MVFCLDLPNLPGFSKTHLNSAVGDLPIYLVDRERTPNFGVDLPIYLVDSERTLVFCLDLPNLPGFSKSHLNSAVGDLPIYLVDRERTPNFGGIYKSTW